MASSALVFRTHGSEPYRHIQDHGSLVRKIFDGIGADHMPHRTRSEAIAHHGVHAVRQGGESLVTGAFLGAIHAELGLDIKGEIPMDLLLAVAGYGYAMWKAHEELATDARNIATTALGIFAFRSTYGFLAAKKLAGGGTPAGVFKSPAVPGMKAHGDFGDDVGEDPILKMARAL